MNFLWTTFTRFEPAADLHAASTRVVRNHLAYSAPVLIDARMKPWYPKELSCRDDVAATVTRRWREYFPRRRDGRGTRPPRSAGWAAASPGFDSLTRRFRRLRLGLLGQIGQPCPSSEPCAGVRRAARLGQPRALVEQLCAPRSRRGPPAPSTPFSPRASLASTRHRRSSLPIRPPRSASSSDRLPRQLERRHRLALRCQRPVDRQAQQRAMANRGRPAGRSGNGCILFDIATIDLHPWIRTGCRLPAEQAPPAHCASRWTAACYGPLPGSSGAARLLLDRAGPPGGSAGEIADPAPLLESALSAQLRFRALPRSRRARGSIGAWCAAPGRWIVVSTQPAAIAEAAAR
jgi:hypothetical protein